MTNKKLKIVTIVGTRPEIIRLSRTMALLDEFTNQVIIHTGQNYDYELNEVFWKELELRKPDYFLDAAAGTAAQLPFRNNHSCLFATTIAQHSCLFATTVARSTRHHACEPKQGKKRTGTGGTRW